MMMMTVKCKMMSENDGEGDGLLLMMMIIRKPTCIDDDDDGIDSWRSQLMLDN